MPLFGPNVTLYHWLSLKTGTILGTISDSESQTLKGDVHELMNSIT